MQLPVKLSVQEADFSPGAEEAWMRRAGCGVGALATFTGYVRDQNNNDPVYRLRLEHYPGMTEKAIAAIIAEASERWMLLGVDVIHRVGELVPGDRIVYVGVASAHRGDAFAACEFIMDYLKTRAPFWKKETSGKGECWLDVRGSDSAAAKRW